jgi:hypothetical protein
MKIEVKNQTDNTELYFEDIDSAITQIKREMRWNQTLAESNLSVKPKCITIKMKIYEIKKDE